MKQTSVEWLENEFKEAHKMFGGIDTNWIKRFDQAKAMEKEQIFEAFKTGTKMIDIENEFDALFNAIIYYKETYESNTRV